MKAFFSNIVGDLREKRLLPVAILLVAGLVAVPVLLAKPAPGPASSAPDPLAATAKESQASAALVALAQEDAGTGSTLKLFDPRDPFAAEGVKNLQSLDSSSLDNASTQLAEADQSSGADTGSTGGGASGGGGSGSTDSGPASGGGGGTTPGGTSPGGGGGGSTHVTNYTYVLDVTFTADGRKHSYTGMNKLTQLPSDENPLLLFLGVDSTGDNAVFLVDSTLKAEGEGDCTPSESDCATLSIAPGAIERFSDDSGRSYTLRIDEIRKVKIGRASASSQPRARTASSTRSDSAETADAPPARRFNPPLLADLVTVATQHTADSSTDKDSR